MVTDLYPFHLQAPKVRLMLRIFDRSVRIDHLRQLGLWTMSVLVSPFISPFVFGFLVAHQSWRWAYGIASIYGLVVVLTIMFFMEETYVAHTP